MIRDAFSKVLQFPSMVVIGGAVSPPTAVVSFHPARMPVGLLLTVGGCVVGTYAGQLCAFLLDKVHYWIH